MRYIAQKIANAHTAFNERRLALLQQVITRNGLLARNPKSLKLAYQSAWTRMLYGFLTPVSLTCVFAAWLHKFVVYFFAVSFLDIPDLRLFLYLQGQFLFGLLVMMFAVFASGGLYPRILPIFRPTMFFALVVFAAIYVPAQRAMMGFVQIPDNIVFSSQVYINATLTFVALIWLVLGCDRRINPSHEFYRMTEKERRMHDLLARVQVVQAKGHYVRFYTDMGETVLRMPFSKVVERLDPEQGMVVHRSYWVRFDAVVRTERMGRKHEVIMQNGTIAPVSATHYPRLQLATGASPASHDI